jgi:hypothetical protein
MKHPVYTIYGALLLLALGFAQYRGLALDSGLHQTKRVPRSIRDNPASSRPSYGYFPRVFGGK